MTAKQPTGQPIEAPVHVPTDPELIAAARRGDLDAFDSLADRHREAAARLARRTATGSTDDLVAETLAAVRAELRAGAGPDTAFRPYLLTTLRRRNLARAKNARRARPLDELATGRVGELPADCVPLTVATYRALPEAAQVALWHVDVENEPPLDTARLLGITATEVAALAFSARDAIRTAQPAEHRAAVEDELALLVAAAVLGPAAEPYLGREPARHARPHSLLPARALVAVGSAVLLVAAGLLGTLAMSSPDRREAAPQFGASSAPRTAAAFEVEAEDGPDSGSGRSGKKDKDRSERVPAATAPRPVPLTPSPSSVAPAEARSVAPQSAAPAATPAQTPTAMAAVEQTEEPAQQPSEQPVRVDLGLTTLNITPGAGPLGLPGLSLG